MGLSRAGFDVTGVDLVSQPHYPFEFILGDALGVSAFDLSVYALIWASPPCQAFSVITKKAHRARHPDLIGPTRSILAQAHKKFGTLTVIENVPGAPIRADVSLDGDMFGLGTYRRRIFETNFFLLHPSRNRAFGPESRPGSVIVTNSGGSTVRTVVEKGRVRYRRKGSTPEYRVAMEIDWMTRAEIAEAIPPAYAEFIGRAAISSLNRAAA
jgi:DNA (cytosine-5)-methyltransferase 1